jgi:hypothetical protein
MHRQINDETRRIADNIVQAAGAVAALASEERRISMSTSAIAGTGH